MQFITLDETHQRNGLNKYSRRTTEQIQIRRKHPTLIRPPHVKDSPGGHPNSPTCGHLKILHLS
jgi:hypothetical protein